MNFFSAPYRVSRCVFATAILICLSSISFGSLAFAQTTVNSTWNGGMFAWSRASNWTPAAVPNNGGGTVYNVTIDSGGSDVVFLDLSPTIASLVLGGTTGSSTLQNLSGNAQTLTVTGGLTVNKTGNFVLGDSSGTHDVANIGTLTNSGTVTIDAGATLNLTNQPSGITDVVAASTLDVAGTFKAGANNGLANLNSIEGALFLANAQSTTITPVSGTLTVSQSGYFQTGNSVGGNSVTVNGNFSNAGRVFIAGSGDALTITGTLINTATGGDSFSIGTFSGSVVVNVGTLNNTGDIIIGSGSTLNLTNTPGGITDLASGTLEVAGMVTAGGNNAFANLNSIEGGLVLENGQSTTITPGSGTLTISGSGCLTVGVGTGTVVTVSGNVNNSGLLSVTDTLTVTGAFTNNAGGTMAVGGAANVATLSNSGTIVIGSTFDTGATLNLTNQPGGITDIVAGSNFQVYGTFTAGSNNALANLNSIEGTLLLANGQSTTITPGSGTLTVSSSGVLETTEVFPTNLTVAGNLTNSGTVEDFALGNLTVTGTFTNNAGASLVVATGGNNTFGTTLGALNNNGTVTVTSSPLNVGTLTNSGTINLTVQGAGGPATLAVTNAGTLTNSGTINLNGSTFAGGVLKISGNVTLSGKGTINLTCCNSFIQGAAGTDTLTNHDNTIQGAGNIGNNSMALKNQATINANQAAAVLIIQASNGVTNSGTMEATNTATLQLDAGTYTQTGSGIVEASATGSIVSTVLLENGVTISGGTLTTGKSGVIQTAAGAAVTLNGVTNSGTFQVSDTSTLTVVGTINNSGSISLKAATGPTTLLISGNVTLSGKGSVSLSNNANNIITGASSSNVLTSSNTISGSGNIGSGSMGLVNTGNINATQSTALIIDVGSAGFNNKGTLTVSTGDTLQITGAVNSFLNFSSPTSTLTGGIYSVSGTLQFDNAAIATNAANITLSGTSSTITNQSGVDALAGIFATNTSKGSFTLKGNRNLTTANSAFTNAGTMTISKGSTFTVGGTSANNYNQTAGRTTVDGTLAVPTGGTVNVTGGTMQGAGAFSANFSLGNATGPAVKFTIGDSTAKSALVTITGAYTQLATGTMNVQIGGTTVGTQYSQLAVTGAATLGGTLNIALISGFTPTVGQTFTIMTYASHGTTQFTTVNGLAINSTEHFTITYNATSIVLTVVSGPCCAAALPADHNPADTRVAGDFRATPAVAPGSSPAAKWNRGRPRVLAKNAALRADHNLRESPVAAAAATVRPASAWRSAAGKKSLFADHQRPASSISARFADHNPSQFSSGNFTRPSWAAGPSSASGSQARFADHNLRERNIGRISLPRLSKVSFNRPRA